MTSQSTPRKPARREAANYYIYLVTGEVITVTPDQVREDEGSLYVQTGEHPDVIIPRSMVYLCGPTEVAPPGFS